MNASSLTHKVFFRTGCVFIESNLDIISLGNAISHRLFKGLSFGGLGNYIRDEIPAIYINDILGCRLILQGYSGKEGYNLILEEYSFPHYLFEQEGKIPVQVDLSGNLYLLIKDIPEILASVED